jgi:hypothetical protein
MGFVGCPHHPKLSIVPGVDNPSHIAVFERNSIDFGWAAFQGPYFLKAGRLYVPEFRQGVLK